MRAFATKTELMAHQREAVAKVRPSRAGALFMDMGTGKSRTSIELASIRHGKVDKVVWFTPVSLKLSVAEEIRKHTDCRDIYVFDGKTKARNLPSARWHIVGIESMSSSNRVVAAVNHLITKRTMVTLDESSYIKGHNSKRTERLTFICSRARYRLILTGTPLSQGVVDLFAQMRFLSPKILGYGSFYSFAANHLEYSEKFPGMIVRAHNTEWLAAKINPYVYQVRKDECVDLPPKHYST
ncbi:MAG: SNF2-related protein, partial [Candidatus Methanomethylophilus sp.]|nr:SNF2-related protein [Methanomethylophilus sp.]